MSVADAIAQQRRAAMARRMGIQPWMLDMIIAENPGFMRSVLADNRRGHAPAPITPAKELSPEERKQIEAEQERKRAREAERGPTPPAWGWREAEPLGLPEGTRWVDQQLDAQDASDRAERERRVRR